MKIDLSGECVFAKTVCDGERDCSDGEDEQDCLNYVGMFVKESGFKVQLNYVTLPHVFTGLKGTLPHVFTTLKSTLLLVFTTLKDTLPHLLNVFKSLLYLRH
jgi:hypothetical protein